MNNQKLLLIIAIFFTIFLLWEKWQIKHSVPAIDDAIQKPEVSMSMQSSEMSSEIPSVDTQAIKVDMPLLGVDDKEGFTTVNTDLLTVQISHKGGTIQNALLNTYPVKVKSDAKFQLLSNETNKLFQAQSGLASLDNALPTHLSDFSSINTNYQMSGDTLVVPLVWQDKNGVKVIKRFHFKKNSYVIGVDYQVFNDSNNNIPAKPYVRLSRNSIDQSNLMMPTFTGGLIYDKQNNTVQKNDFEDWGDFDKQNAVGGWIAIAQQYFMAAWIPNQNQQQVFSSSATNGIYKLTNENPQISIAAGGQSTIDANQLYIGPKEYGKIEKVAAGLNYTLDYGWLDILADPLSWLIHKINGFIDSWGWSIILITILIKLVFYPLSEKSYRSMAKMRVLAPRLTKLRDAYGDDKQKMGQKTMELYKQEKVNPASGCLPILLQIPVFIAFYWMLLDTVELRQTAFWWVSDLSEMDPYYILPIIMGVSMFVQQKLNPPPTDPMQAKIMMSLPFVFTVMFLWFPAGLVLYWVFNNILSIAQQWTINKRIDN